MATEGKPAKLHLVALALWLAWAGTPCDGQGIAPVHTPRAVAIRDTHVALLGRYGEVAGANGASAKAVRIGYPGTGFVVAVRGHALDLRLNSTTATNALTVVVDHGEPALVVLGKGEQDVTLLREAATTAGGSGTPEPTHIVEVYKRSETWQGLVDLQSLLPGPGSELLDAPPLPARKLLFVGDSVTCGAAVARDEKCTNDPARPNEDPYHAFDMALGRRLDAQVELVCYGGRGLQRDYRGLSLRDGVLNAPDYLDLAVATDDAASRQSWEVHRWVPAGIVVALGTNDFSLEKTKPLDGTAFVGDYVTLLRRLRGEYPAAMILATEGPIVTDPRLRLYVQQAVRQAADPHIVWAEATHYPGNSCDGHPTLQQHSRIADDLEPLLRKELGW